MYAASSRYSANPQRAFSGRRTVSLALALAAHLVILLLLLWQAAPRFSQMAPSQPMSTFNVLPGSEAEPAKQKAVKEQHKQKAASAEAPVKKRTPPEIEKPRIDTAPAPLAMILMSRKDFAAADIGKIPSRPGAGAQGKAGDAQAGASQGPGEGPGGQKLYNADWYRRPTSAELATYIPKNAPPDGWGLIACQTIDRYQVDNCRELGESPRGSGLARAVRQAAWQFRVLPPRVGGRLMVGSWVRIRIDYTRGVAEASGG